MSLKNAKILFLFAMLAVAFFSASAISITIADPRSIENPTGHLTTNKPSHSIFLGDPVPGGGTPNSGNQTGNTTL